VVIVDVPFKDVGHLGSDPPPQRDYDHHMHDRSNRYESTRYRAEVDNPGSYIA
jgi:hypothetical protein